MARKKPATKQTKSTSARGKKSVKNEVKEEKQKEE